MKPEQNDSRNDPLMLSMKDVAHLMQCSDKHVVNLRKQARMPACIKLGTLVRWPRTLIEAWIADGCPEVGELGRSGTA
jgi:predicted DNA-binding transcriptional regulator AlpA